MKSFPSKQPVYLDEEESGRLFKLLVDSVTDYAIFLLDVDGHIMTWNTGAERFKGYKPHEIIGKHFSVFYTKKDLETRKPWRELEVAAEVGRFEDEGWRLRSDGSRFWANVIIIALKDRDGKLHGFGKITRDLTERRDAEIRYRLLVEGVRDYAIYSLDVNGNVTSWNSGAERIKGYSASEIIGQHFSNFYTPEDRERKMPDYVLRTAAEQGHFEGEGWRVRKDGSRFWSSVVVTPLYDDEGTLRGYSKVTRDVTDRKKLMDEISKHAAELEIEIQERERTNSELESFSYSVSHDLRAPLRAIEGFSTALREDYGEQLPEGAFEYLDEISKAAVRMNRLVQDLLDYSRLSRLELPLTPTFVRNAVDEAIRELGPAIGAISIDVPESLAVMAHPVTLVQILANLISNAVKFRDPAREQKVLVSATIEGDRAAIRVQDNGIGIEQRYLDRIFKVFERLHGSEDFPGTGIGLAIVQRGLERMSGKIAVESEPGVGSTFTISLPLATAERLNDDPAS